jgi:hypothetical protein
MDAYVKTVLTVIAACLLLQVAQGFGLAGTPGPGQVSSSGAETASPYQMVPIPMARLVFRFDRATGRTWTMPLPPEKEKFWTPVDEASPEPMVREEEEGAPSLPDEPGEAEE